MCVELLYFLEFFLPLKSSPIDSPAQAERMLAMDSAQACNKNNEWVGIGVQKFNHTSS